MSKDKKPEVKYEIGRPKKYTFEYCFGEIIDIFNTLYHKDSKHLTIQDLIYILTKVKNNPVDQYTKLFAKSDAKLEFTQEGLEAIAKLAKDQKTGARGLKTIMENVLLDAMFELKSTTVTNDDVKKIQSSLERYSED